MKKILVISHNFALEGSTKSLFILASNLNNKENIVSVYSRKHGIMEQMYSHEKINIIDRNNLSAEVKNSDIIIVNTIIEYDFIKKNIEFANKMIWIIRESERENYFSEFNDLNSKIFTSVNKVVFVADSTSRIYEDLNINNNFITIHNGIDLKQVDMYKENNSKQKVRQKYGYNKEDKIVSIIGTLCLRKGQLEFVECAVNILSSTKNNNLKFLIIGEQKENGYVNRIKQIIKGYERNIILIKETPDILDYYNMSDIFVCNSYIESFPRVILEAMAFELPIIATNIYGIPVQISDKKDGILIPAGDSVSLQTAMQYLMDNPKICEKYSQEAYKTVVKKFDHKKTIENYKHLISII